MTRATAIATALAAGVAVPAATYARTAPSRATVTHLAPSSARAGHDIRLVAVVDHAWTETELVVRYRRYRSGQKFDRVAFERSSAGGYYAVIPATAVRRPGVEYYIAGRTSDGHDVVHFASADEPHVVSVQPTLQESWQHAELDRLHGYRSRVNVRMFGHNFDNRDPDRRDYYLRGELEWTHRLLQTVYSISLGYGFIEGRTPSLDDPGDMRTGARYGYGGLRFRLGKWGSARARAYLGVDREEFIVGVSGELTLGKWYQSSVNLGGEVLENQGSSLWVRLQWDTVAPFLMGAAVYKTDLPGAELSDGAYIVYDIAYPMTERLTLRGSISFGSRDGPANFGGGLGTSFAF